MLERLTIVDKVVCVCVLGGGWAWLRLTNTASQAVFILYSLLCFDISDDLNVLWFDRARRRQPLIFHLSLCFRLLLTSLSSLAM